MPRPVWGRVRLPTNKEPEGPGNPCSGPQAPVDPSRREPLGEAILALLDRRYENDALGALVLGGLSIRQVELLRSYIHYARQLRVPFAKTSMAAALVKRPEIARALVDHFVTKFRPAVEAGTSGPPGKGERQRALEASRASVLGLIDRVEDIQEDRILRGLLELVDATVRTNWFQQGGSRTRTAFKIRSALVSAMPRPVPLFEIFVHDADVEGIHLRSGKVARGGIRWSDRRDDFRTEVLGLMRTQFVKNAVIVPVGSKGGFVLKRAGDRPSRAQVEAAYTTFISGLLDITDNLVEGKVVHPADTVIDDGPDPYLVVAADKGTATFSDLANSIAAGYGFWLGDAFASGGSRGYDHKKEGITARGAWECVKGHLRELGIDPAGEITVAGIGDMSGDVFGNGLLLSRRFKLVAAFDHRHVLLDPAPDPEVSWAERKRLFEKPGSSWADYDPAKISSGGGIFGRDAKRIPLSPQGRSLLGVSVEALTGEALVRAVLKLPVDLLWNGGIGTYVKASTETSADAGDSRNDAVRIDAADLRARVVGEGGNLGFTPAGRVEYALRGGRINTDFIDNSAGVDLSDHEVNIKIALGEAIRAGRLEPEGRDGFLRSMASEVAGQVLTNNRAHQIVLSIEEILSREDLSDARNLAGELTEAGLLEAKFERFPGPVEMEARAEGRTGLVRPELAILLAFSKIVSSRALRETDLVESPGFEAYLPGYFPAPVRERFSDLLGRHPLHREIAVSALVNEIVARMGIAFVTRERADLGATVDDAVVRAYRAATLLLDAGAIPDSVPALLDAGRIPSAGARALLLAYRDACAEVVRFILRRWPRSEDGSPASAAAVAAGGSEGFRRISKWLAGQAPASLRDRIASREAEIAASGAPGELARRAALLDLERKSPLALDAARRAGVGPEAGIHALFSVRAALRFDGVERGAREMPVASPEDRSAARGLILEMESALADLAGAALAAGPAGAGPEETVENFLAARPDPVAAWRRALPEVGRPLGLGRLLVLAGRLRRLVG